MSVEGFEQVQLIPICLVSFAIEIPLAVLLESMAHKVPWSNEPKRAQDY